jgi:hypothetical protein
MTNLMLVDVLEMPSANQERWPFEEWRCQMGQDCCCTDPAPLGHWLTEDYYGNEVGSVGYPFIAVFDDGTVLMVCEDCAVNLEEERALAEQSFRDEQYRQMET